MTDERRIEELVEEALDSERTPEEVCREFPELLPQVRARLVGVRQVDEELDLLLPDARPDESSPPTWPSIPGYELKALLGRGGMGVVYRARHLRLERDVALKMLLAGEFASRRELERFFLEARAIAKLSHPNIVQVHDVSEREGRPFFTMELIEGGTLAQSLAGTPQPAERAAELVRCLAQAVAAAHASGIIHRDLKPSNVLLTSDGTPKVTDFGLARRVSGDEHLTASGAILGTPSYMAPEQIRGAAVGSGADVYGLGAVLYEVLTGRPPFRSDSPLATQMQVLSTDPARPSLLNGKVPRDLETICLRCLHKDPARRYESAAELDAELRRFLNREPIRARPVGRFERALLWGRRHPTKLTLISFGVVLLCFALVRAVQVQALARETRAQEAVWAPRIGGAHALLRNGDLARARSLLDQVPDTLSAELRQRVSAARRELRLVEQLDEIRLHRVEITEGRFDRSENRKVADEAYGAAFRAAGLGSVGDDPEVVAARVREAAVSTALVGALDDWAFCAGDGPSRAWVLDVARRSDPASTPWRERLHEPTLRLDAECASLAELEVDVRAHRTTVQLLVGAAERMREAGVDAVPLLTLVQRAHPGDFWVNFALADVRWQDPEEAIRYAQAAVAIRPRASIAHQALGTALRKAGRVDEGLEAYRQAVLVEPDFAEAHGRLAMVLLAAGKLDEAIAESREAIRIDPAIAWVHLNLGTALFSQQRFEAAQHAYRDALRLDPRSGMAHENLGHCLSSLGREREARESFRHAVELEPTASHRYELAACLAGLDELEAAEAEYRRVLALDPAHAGSRSDLRRLLVRMERGQEALTLFREAIDADPSDLLAWDGYPELCAYLGREEDHRRACEELLERVGQGVEPRDCERIGRACLLLSSASTLPRAVALIERALASSQSPAWTRPYFELAKALAEYRLGRFESAIELLSGAAGQALTPLPELIRAMALQRTGAAADARRNLAAAALSFDWSPSAATDQNGWILHVLRREAEALILPELADLLAGREQPRDDDTRAAMISAFLAADDHAAAARLCERFLDERFELDREQRHQAARVLARAGAGLGVDPAESLERARFRERALDELRSELASFDHDLGSGGAERREAARSRWISSSNDPAFAVLREPAAMEPLSTAQRDRCRAFWRDVEERLQRLEVEE